MLSTLSSGAARQFLRRIRLAPKFRKFASKGFLGFKSPGDVIAAARKAIATSEELQALLLDSADAPRSLRYADDISNALCLVADAASGIHNVNIGAQWDDACSLALHSVEQHMRALNVNVRIYEKLLSFSQRGLLSQPEEDVLGLFIRDFEDSLVHLPLQQRLTMQRLLQRESQASEAYLEADRAANADHIQLSTSLPSNGNGFLGLFPAASSTQVSANFADVVSLLQQSDSPAARAEVRAAALHACRHRIQWYHRPEYLLTFFRYGSAATTRM